MYYLVLILLLFSLLLLYLSLLWKRSKEDFYSNENKNQTQRYILEPEIFYHILDGFNSSDIIFYSEDPRSG